MTHFVDWIERRRFPFVTVVLGCFASTALLFVWLGLNVELWDAIAPDWRPYGELTTGMVIPGLALALWIDLRTRKAGE